jgi:hypothetical protein
MSFVILLFDDRNILLIRVFVPSNQTPVITYKHACSVADPEVIVSALHPDPDNSSKQLLE